MTPNPRSPSCLAVPIGRTLLTLVLFAAAGVRHAGAQPTPHGAEFVANFYTTGQQLAPSVALGDNGRLMVVWRSTHGTDPEGIYAREFATRGAPVEEQFLVNSFTTDFQNEPAVAAGSGGDFILVWQSNGSPGNDTSSFSIQGTVVEGGTGTTGSQFQVNDFTTGSQFASAVAADAAGDFVVVWASASSAGGDTLGNSVQARLFDASGAPLGDQFQVNTYTTGDQALPAVARNGAGEFVVVWFGGAESGDYFDVLGQRYDADGDPVGGEFLANLETSDSQAAGSVGIGADGSFLVAWESNVSAGDDDDETSIQARWFDADGVASAPEMQVNTYTTGFQNKISVAGRGNGFVVSWRSETDPVADDDLSVQARQFASTGNPLGPPFQVNVFTTGAQDTPAVAVDSKGNFVVAYESWASPVDTANIRARSYDALFRDDFESGDPNRWVLGPP